MPGTDDTTDEQQLASTAQPTHGRCSRLKRRSSAFSAAASVRHARTDRRPGMPSLSLAFVNISALAALPPHGRLQILRAPRKRLSTLFSEPTYAEPSANSRYRLLRHDAIASSALMTANLLSQFRRQLHAGSMGFSSWSRHRRCRLTAATLRLARHPAPSPTTAICHLRGAHDHPHAVAPGAMWRKSTADSRPRLKPQHPRPLHRMRHRGGRSAQHVANACSLDCSHHPWALKPRPQFHHRKLPQRPGPSRRLRLLKPGALGAEYRCDARYHFRAPHSDRRFAHRDLGQYLSLTPKSRNRRPNS